MIFAKKTCFHVYEGGIFRKGYCILDANGSLFTIVTIKVEDEPMLDRCSTDNLSKYWKYRVSIKSGTKEFFEP